MASSEIIRYFRLVSSLQDFAWETLLRNVGENSDADKSRSTA
jgi:hypothetical protein